MTRQTTTKPFKITRLHLACVSALGLALAMGAGSAAQARDYDGYCYQEQSHAQTKGTVIGAVAGGAIGSGVAARGHKTDGAILGAVVGGLVGNKVGKDSKQSNDPGCYQGRYYINEGEAPPPPPSGYRVAYFYDRPHYDNYYVYRDGREERWDDRHHDHDRHYHDGY